MKNNTQLPYRTEAIENFEPHHLTAPAPWAGHLPFARWLIEILSPKVLVELGAYSGISYLGFCQAVLEVNLPTRCFAVDTWQGDSHAGAYGEHIYQAFRQAHDPYYASISTPLRMSFDEAHAQFKDQSIDLLHIDGLHTYEAVKHDFETWKQKCSDRAVVLFHDTDVYRDDFGVYRFWDEIRTQYPCFRFHHSNGLGVLLLGKNQHPDLLAIAKSSENLTRAQQYFSRLGRAFERLDALLISKYQLTEAQTQIQTEQLGSQRRHEYILSQDTNILALQRELTQAKTHGEHWVIEATRFQERLSYSEQRFTEQSNKFLAQESAHTSQNQLHQQSIEQKNQTIETLQAQTQQQQANIERLQTNTEQLQAQTIALQTHADQLLEKNQLQEIQLHHLSELTQQQTEALHIANEKSLQQSKELKNAQALTNQQRQELDMVHQLAKEKSTELELTAHAKKQLQNELLESHAQAQQLNFDLQQGREQAQQQATLISTITTQSEARHAWLVQQDATIQRLEQKQNEIYSSRSWKVTKPLRAIGDFARYLGVVKALKKSRRLAEHGKNALRYVARGDFKGLTARVKQIRQQNRLQGAITHVQRLVADDSRQLTIGILCTPHTVFVARGLCEVLSQLNIQAEICSAQNHSSEYQLHVYIVICPQMFEVLPPGEKRIFMQMEQGVSSRWFTSEYLQNMQNSLAIADYSVWNLGYLQTLGVAYAQTYLIPVCGVPNYEDSLSLHSKSSSETKPTVLFYGDIQCERRQRYLNTLRQGLQGIATLRVENNLFGSELYQAVRQADLVVNIHYYEGALLETTRLYECLSLGATIVSELGSDQRHHSTYAQCIEFVPVGDEQAMLIKCKELLKQTEAQKQSRLLRIEQEIARSQTHTRFLMARMLFALGLMPWQDLIQFTSLESSSNHLVLSLPETPARRNKFMQTMPQEFAFFDGLRMRPGWIGCALSYKYLCTQALAAGIDRLTVLEDDAILPNQFSEKFASIQEYLERHDWHIFSGLIAVLPPSTKVLDIQLHHDVIVLTIDRMLSMVCNIYNKQAMELISNWDPANDDPHTNTIDQYLSQRQLRIVTTLPFFVGYDEDLDSTLWGTNNSMYRPLLNASEEKLRLLAIDWCRLHSPQRLDILQRLQELEKPTTDAKLPAASI